jgi:hypothetical protein
VPYHALLTTDIWGTFGSGVTKGAVITALKNDGVTKFADLDGLSVERGRGGNPGALTFDSKYALLLGTDKGSRTTLDKDIMKFCEDREIDRIGLNKPERNEWMACVTFVDPDSGTPTFQVVGCVGSSGLASAGVDWKKEDKPPQLWTTHAVYDAPSAAKEVRDIRSFTGRGRW